MNELSPSQQNPTSPMRRSFVTGEMLTALLSAELDRCFQDSGQALESWLYGMVASTGRSKATIYRALTGEGEAKMDTAFALCDVLGPNAMSQLLSAIGMKAVRHNDELAALRKRNSELEMLVTNMGGLLDEARGKRSG